MPGSCTGNGCGRQERGSSAGKVIVGSPVGKLKLLKFDLEMAATALQPSGNGARSWDGLQHCPRHRCHPAPACCGVQGCPVPTPARGEPLPSAWWGRPTGQHWGSWGQQVPGHNTRSQCGGTGPRSTPRGLPGRGGDRVSGVSTLRAPQARPATTTSASTCPPGHHGQREGDGFVPPPMAQAQAPGRSWLSRLHMSAIQESISGRAFRYWHESCLAAK